MRKKIFIILIAIIGLLGIVLSIRFLSGEDSWICENGQWIKHGHPRDPKPSISCPEQAQSKKETFTAELADYNLYSREGQEKIRIKFGEEVEAATLNSSNIKVWALGKNDNLAEERTEISKFAGLIYEYDGESKILLIKSATGKISDCEGCLYEVELNDGVRSLAGRHLLPTLLRINQPEIPSEKNIEVFSPGDGDEVSFPFTVKGRARVFENTVNIDLKEKNGSVLSQGLAMAESPDMGQFGNFEKEIAYFLKSPQTEDIVLEVYWRSPKDGAKIDLISIPLKLKQVETATVNLYFTNNKLDPQISCNKVFPVERIISKTQSPAKRAIELLLEGPSWNEYSEEYSTSINQGVKLNSLNVKDGIAKVDFNQMLENNVGGSCRAAAIRAEITETLKQFSTVKDVVISIEGRTEDILQP